jgi:hypothetical protein
MQRSTTKPCKVMQLWTSVWNVPGSYSGLPVTLTEDLNVISQSVQSNNSIVYREIGHDRFIPDNCIRVFAYRPVAKRSLCKERPFHSSRWETKFHTHIKPVKLVLCVWMFTGWNKRSYDNSFKKKFKNPYTNLICILLSCERSCRSSSG